MALVQDPDPDRLRLYAEAPWRGAGDLEGGGQYGRDTGHHSAATPADTGPAHQPTYSKQIGPTKEQA